MAVTINDYNHLGLIQGQKLVHLTTDTFKCALMNASHGFTPTNTIWTNVSANEISGADANGYTSPGQNLATLSWSETGGTATWDAANVTWTATGGSITASHSVIYDDTVVTPADALMFDINFGGVETAGDGTPFNINWDAAGIFTVG